MPEIIKKQVMDMVREHLSEAFETESILFQKGWSPIEFHKPDDLHGIIEKISSK
ncbi:DUF3898 domain-containing protein [Priestia megaterium]|uniref:DUF3898 domain-containing protein n=1 Tax=Priestia megaterium TaxID=1404 RepID=UPI0021BE6BE5|nr:DUF3898 domain-containing protein [Priestia megaterium]